MMQQNYLDLSQRLTLEAGKFVRHYCVSKLVKSNMRYVTLSGDT